MNETPSSEHGSATSRSPAEIAAATEAVKAEALRLGFDAVGVCRAGLANTLDALDAWLAAGYAAGMTYVARRREAYEHPARLLPDCRSVIMVVWRYPAEKQNFGAVCEDGRVARYARGRDYHDVLRPLLKRLGRFVGERIPGARWRAFVDTAPILEREWAQRAGLGWIGKNSMLLRRDYGSWFLLGGLLTTAELVCDEPWIADHCGTCRRCLDACPTQAFPQPYVLDARRCISYWTIETQDPFPESVHERLSGWLFGCDVCQEVCPWNRKAQATTRPLPQPFVPGTLDPVEILTLDEEAFRRKFKATPLWRAKRRGLFRTAITLLADRARRNGGRLDTRERAALHQAAHDRDEIVRHAAEEVLRFTENGRTTSDRRDEGCGGSR
ncbi:tRNA epoxyqueuosine(34) reductase QueG [Thermostilla marina]